MNDRLLTTLRTAAAVGLGPDAGRAAAGGRRPPAQPRRVPGTDPAGRTARARRAADRPPRQGRRVPRTARRWRTSTGRFNPSIPKKQVFDLATCRFVRERRDVLAARPAGHGQELPGPGHRLPGHQAGLHRAVPLDLRRGPRLPARRGARRRGQGAGPVPQARPADHRRHGHEATAASGRASTCSRSSCGATRPARR